MRTGLSSNAPVSDDTCFDPIRHLSESIVTAQQWDRVPVVHKTIEYFHLLFTWRAIITKTYCRRLALVCRLVRWLLATVPRAKLKSMNQNGFRALRSGESGLKAETFFAPVSDIFFFFNEKSQVTSVGSMAAGELKRRKFGD